MDRRYFEFESITGKDENNTPKVEIGTDIRSGIRFNLRLNNIYQIRDFFQFNNYLSKLKTPAYERSMIEYKDWYSNEIIRRVTKDTSHYEKQSDAKKEVLKEALQRRNKLVKQISKAMNYYDSKKGKIDQMERVRAIHQNAYPGPMLIWIRNHLILENVTEFGDIYFQLAIKVDKNEVSGEEMEGHGWMEISQGFHEDISALKPPNTAGLILTNSKPRSDMRVLRRGDNRASHQFDLQDKMKNTFSISGMLLMAHHYLGKLEFELRKGQIFNLVNLITSRFSENITIKIALKSSNEFSSRIEGYGIEIGLSNFQLTRVEFEVNTAIFYSLRFLMAKISKIRVSVMNRIFGVLFKVDLGKNMLKILSIPDILRKDNFLRESLRSYLINHKTTLPEMDKIAVLNGEAQFFRENFVYKRMIFDREIEILNSNRQKKAFILAQYQRYRFSIEKSNVTYQHEEVSATIRLDVTNLTLIWDCNCPSYHIKFKCEHLLAMFYLGIREGCLIA